MARGDKAEIYLRFVKEKYTKPGEEIQTDKGKLEVPEGFHEATARTMLSVLARAKLLKRIKRRKLEITEDFVRLSYEEMKARYQEQLEGERKNYKLGVRKERRKLIKEELVEIDAGEVFEKVGFEGIFEWLRLKIETFKADAEGLKSEKSSLEKELERNAQDIQRLRHELKEARASNLTRMPSRAEIVTEKTVFVGKAPTGAMEHGSSGVPGAAFASVTVHRKPKMDHPPKAVQDALLEKEKK